MRCETERRVRYVIMVCELLPTCGAPTESQYGLCLPAGV